MSYTEEELKNTVRRAVQEALIAERSQVSGTSQRPQEREDHHSLEAIDDCPDCHAAFKVDQFKAKTIRKAWDERKNLSMKCKSCGFPVKAKNRDGFTEATEDKDCPLCHSKEAEDRYKWE